LADIYALSIDAGEGKVITKLFGKELANAYLEAGWRVAAQGEIDKEIVNLKNEPDWVNYLRQVQATKTPTYAERAPELKARVISAQGIIDSYSPRMDAFVAKVGATDAEVVTGKLTGNRPLTWAEKMEWEKLCVGATGAVYDKVYSQKELDTPGYERPQNVTPNVMNSPVAEWNSKVGEQQQNTMASMFKQKSVASSVSGSGGSSGLGISKGAHGSYSLKKRDGGSRDRPQGAEDNLAGSGLKVSEESSLESKGESLGMKVSGWYPITRPVSSSRQNEGLPQSHGRPWISSTKGVR